MIDLEKISEALAGWNVQVQIAENAELCERLKHAYPGWNHADTFSRISVELTSDPWGHGLLHRDDQDYIRLEPQNALRDDVDDFIKDGLVIIGNGPSGDFLVIDTKDSAGIAVGYVSHDALWELKMSPRSCYGKVADNLENYLTRLSADPDCPLEHPGWPPDENPWRSLLDKFS